jgi:ankyrin repeat protein
MLAARFNLVNIAKAILLRDPQKLDQINEFGATALMIAVFNKNEEMVKFLLKKKCKCTTSNRNTKRNSFDNCS